MVRIEMENGGIIDIELYEDKAPVTVANFKSHFTYIDKDMHRDSKKTEPKMHIHIFFAW